MTSANNTTLYVLHETLTLQVDLAHQSIQGIAELDLYNQDSFLNGIRLNARQMKIEKVFVDGIEAFFNHYDPLSNLFPADPSNVARDLSSYHAFHDHLQREADKGELFIELPRDLMNTFTEKQIQISQSLTNSPIHPRGPSSVRVTVHYRLDNPQAAVYFTHCESLVNPRHYQSLSDRSHKQTHPHVFVSIDPCRTPARLWIPCIDNPMAKCPWLIKIAVLGLTNASVVCSGEMKEKETVTVPGNGLTPETSLVYHVREISIPVCAYSVAFAIGDFAKVKDEGCRRRITHYCFPGMERSVEQILSVFRHGMGYIGEYLRPNDSIKYDAAKRVGSNNDEIDVRMARYLSLLTYQDETLMQVEQREFNKLKGVFKSDKEVGQNTFFDITPPRKVQMMRYSQVFVSNAPHDISCSVGLTILSDSLLYTPDVIDLDVRWRTHYAICHSLARTIFTHFVTPCSYKDVWLLEGIAGHLAFKAMGQLEACSVHPFPEKIQGVKQQLFYHPIVEKMDKELERNFRSQESRIREYQEMEHVKQVSKTDETMIPLIPRHPDAERSRMMTSAWRMKARVVVGMITRVIGESWLRGRMEHLLKKAREFMVASAEFLPLILHEERRLHNTDGRRSVAPDRSLSVSVQLLTAPDMSTPQSPQNSDQNTKIIIALLARCRLSYSYAQFTKDLKNKDEISISEYETMYLKTNRVPHLQIYFLYAAKELLMKYQITQKDSVHRFKGRILVKQQEVSQTTSHYISIAQTVEQVEIPTPGRMARRRKAHAKRQQADGEGAAETPEQNDSTDFHDAWDNPTPCHTITIDPNLEHLIDFEMATMLDMNMKQFRTNPDPAQRLVGLRMLANLKQDYPVQVARLLSGQSNFDVEEEYSGDDLQIVLMKGEHPLIRRETVQVLAQTEVTSNRKTARGFEGVKRLVTWFKKRCFDFSGNVKPNDFSDESEYETQKAVVEVLGSTRKPDGETDTEIVDILFACFKQNENHGSAISDRYYFASLINSIGMINTSNVEINKDITKQMDIVLQTELMKPSPHYIVLQSLLTAMTSIALSLKVSTTPRSMSVYLDEKFTFEARFAALKCLARLLELFPIPSTQIRSSSHPSTPHSLSMRPSTTPSKPLPPTSLNDKSRDDRKSESPTPVFNAPRRQAGQTMTLPHAVPRDRGSVSQRSSLSPSPVEVDTAAELEREKLKLIPPLFPLLDLCVEMAKNDKDPRMRIRVFEPIVDLIQRLDKSRKAYDTRRTEEHSEKIQTKIQKEQGEILKGRGSTRLEAQPPPSVAPSPVPSQPPPAQAEPRRPLHPAAMTISPHNQMVPVMRSTTPSYNPTMPYMASPAQMMAFRQPFFPTGGMPTPSPSPQQFMPMHMMPRQTAPQTQTLPFMQMNRTTPNPVQPPPSPTPSTPSAEQEPSKINAIVQAHVEQERQAHSGVLQILTISAIPPKTEDVDDKPLPADLDLTLKPVPIVKPDDKLDLREFMFFSDALNRLPRIRMAVPKRPQSVVRHSLDREIVEIKQEMTQLGETPTPSRPPRSVTASTPRPSITMSSQRSGTPTRGGPPQTPAPLIPHQNQTVLTRTRTFVVNLWNVISSGRGSSYDECVSLSAEKLYNILYGDTLPPCFNDDEKLKHQIVPDTSSPLPSPSPIYFSGVKRTLEDLSPSAGDRTLMAAGTKSTIKVEGGGKLRIRKANVVRAIQSVDRDFPKTEEGPEE